MTKTIIATLALLCSLSLSAQDAQPSQGSWELPSQDAQLNKEETPTPAESKLKPQKEYVVNEKDRPYLAGAVPEKEGKVVFSADIPTEGATAEGNYQKAYDFLNNLAHEDCQTNKSQVAIVNPEEHSIIATYTELLTLYKAALELDRTQFNYIIIVSCTDEQVSVSLERLSFDYNYTKTPTHMTAEETITDDQLLTANGTRLKKVYAKFRRAAVDRMRAIMAGMREALK